jgi:hypothetical protein
VRRDLVGNAQKGRSDLGRIVPPGGIELIDRHQLGTHPRELGFRHVSLNGDQPRAFAAITARALGLDFADLAAQMPDVGASAVGKVIQFVLPAVCGQRRVILAAASAFASSLICSSCQCRGFIAWSTMA